MNEPTGLKIGPTMDLFRGMDVIWLLDQWVDRQPDKTFVIWAPFDGEARRWTYAGLARDARRFAAGLHARGLGAGDFVLMHLENSADFLIAWLGCAYLGAVPVTTNTRSVPENVRYFAEVMKPACAITQASLAAMVREACGDEARMILAGDPSPQGDAKTFGAEPFAEVFSDAPLPHLAPDPGRDFAVQFTSGTTSRPKPTVWTNANGLWAGKSMSMNMRLRREDVTLLYMPLFHANAQITFLTALWSGGTVVVHPRFSASRFWDACAAHGVTWVSMIPFAFKALKGRPVPDHKVRVLMGLARLPDAEEEFGVRTMALWGMTETLSSCIVTDPDHPGPAGTMGRPSPFYGVEVRRKDGIPAGPGEQGLLYIRGERGVSLFKEYYRNAEATEAAFDATGALDTGDVVRIDGDGWMFFVNRDKDMLRVGGENVAALEIETAIAETGLAMECAVVAQQHHMLGDVPAAFVTLSEAGKGLGQEDVSRRIIAHCRERLADFKVPRSVHIVDDFPRSTLDRIAKNKLRERLKPIEPD
ncbi:AMP-binding protein [Rhodobium gokarnense]|uniref:Crotonobetaine/carnitine-CoA ligase n=1 Tax=Rhodobium gokarnense TaxID=364296 RepID=A0ABT3HC85_9HYPH|nr:AMP-binding protein [Rhodobium gokarnense]MCW2308008.1 crotonobetaine/carnitine-CoA ligase [Rhodobium gokarnense]